MDYLSPPSTPNSDLITTPDYAATSDTIEDVDGINGKTDDEKKNVGSGEMVLLDKDDNGTQTKKTPSDSQVKDYDDFKVNKQ